MSGIFGVGSLRPKQPVQACLHALDTAHTIYGSSGSGCQLLQEAALGCHLEHFSTDFPPGDAVLKRDGCYAVMDALLFNREALIEKADTPPSDEDLLLDWVLNQGPEALRQVNGDFAGAIYDKKNHSFLLFRDQAGVRPLYIYLKEHVFAFATDLRGLLQMPTVDAALNEHQLYLRMLGCNSNSARETAFAHIHMLPAGHYAHVHLDAAKCTLQERAYYVPGKQKIRLRTRKAYEKQLYTLVEDAVRRRAQAIPGLLGAELSGGLDSAVVSVLLNRSGRDARYFSWSPPVSAHPLQKEDERLLIDSICRQEHIVCHFLPPRQDSLMTLFNRQDPPHVHTLQIGQTAAWMHAQGVRAVFSGHGGDECASHRMDELELWHHGEYLSYVREIYRQMHGRTYPLCRTALHTLRRIRAGKDYVKPFRYKKKLPFHILNQAFAARMADTPLPPLTFGYDPAAYVRDGGQRLRLENAAFQAAEQGVRYLFPLLDVRILDFALGIPRRMFLHRGTDRYIFRKAFASILPANVLEQVRKDSPGIASQSADGRMEDYRMSVSELVQRLDSSRWSAYWNMDLVRQIPDTAGTDISPLDTRNINELFICWIIQHWQEEAKRHA